MNAHFLEWDAGVLGQRIRFLSSRAEYHLAAAGYFDMDGALPEILAGDEEQRACHVACAGALLRDAGAVAILMNDYDQAAALLGRAGDAWVAVGLFSGYLLQQISRREPWWIQVEGESGSINEILSRSIFRETVQRFDLDRPDDRYWWNDSIGSRSQLIQLYMSMEITLDARFNPTDSSLVLDALRKLKSGGTRVFQMSFFAYSELLEGIVKRNLGLDEMNAIRAMVYRRVDQLSDARRDTYHWSRLTAPAAVVDFDLLTLCLLAERLDVTGPAEVLEVQSELVAIPLRGARGLLGRWGYEPLPRNRPNM